MGIVLDLEILSFCTKKADNLETTTTTQKVNTIHDG